MSRSNTLLALTAGLLCCALPALGGEIHRAIEAGDAARVQQILASDPGAVSQRDEDQFHNLPIHTAASAGNVEITRILLDALVAIELLEKRDGAYRNRTELEARLDPPERRAAREPETKRPAAEVPLHAKARRAADGALPEAK